MCLAIEYYSTLLMYTWVIYISSFQILYQNALLGLNERQVHFASPQTYSLVRNFVLSIRFPSSSCSATSRTGNLAGIIRLGVDPGTTEYLEKSEIPHFSRRKSSSVSRSPFTVWCGARSIAKTASENIVYNIVSVLKRPGRVDSIEMGIQVFSNPFCIISQIPYYTL